MRLRRVALSGYLAVLAVTTLLPGCGWIADQLGGRFEGLPSELEHRASPLARELIRHARTGLMPGQISDYHVHIVGLGHSLAPLCPNLPANGTWLNDVYRSWLHPLQRFRYELILSASGVEDESRAELLYLERLLNLARQTGLHATYYLYALDHVYTATADRPVGEVAEKDLEKTDLYIGNQHIVEVANCLNAKAAGGAAFVPVASVHPYRRDAVEELQRVAAAGVRHIKWLPPYQVIDPVHPALQNFYAELRRQDIMLLAHTGAEHTFRVMPEANQELGNPSKLEPALRAGVQVIMLHSGRDGVEHEPGQDGQRRSHFERFRQIMAAYPDHAFGELGAVPYLGTARILDSMIADPSIACRLVDGSDYPNPAIAVINPTGRLLRDGYLRWEGDADDAAAIARKDALDEIYGYNPLLFDFVLKRTIRVNGKPIPAATFVDLKHRRVEDCPRR